MKVIKNNYITNKDENKNIEKKEESIFPLGVVCEYCDSKLAIDKEDTYIGWLGAWYYTCPCCHEENMLDAVEGITLTPENIQFPIHFNHTVRGRNCSHLDKEEVTRIVRNMINNIIKANKPSCSFQTGDSHIIVNKLEDEDVKYEVMVTQDYYSAYVESGDIDYNVENTLFPDEFLDD